MSRTWSGRAANSTLQLLPLVAVAVGIAVAFVAPVWWVGIAIALTGTPIWMFSSLRLTIDSERLLIAFGPLGWPRVRVETSAIARAELIDVRPMAYGGWGYRGGLRMFGKAAAVIRRGDGLKLTLANGNVLVITVDDAPGALAAINALVPATRIG